ncbi:haloalkane dehalogenase [Acidimicrobiaceae bacterium]|nr:haloalkane dehalogenase [Acidimicrobiaceae bacterium]
MKFLQTPDSQFEGLADWPYPPIYTAVKATSASDGVTLRVHHIEARPQSESSGDAVETVFMYAW